MYLKKRNSDDITYFTYIGEKEREREREKGRKTGGIQRRKRNEINSKWDSLRLDRYFHIAPTFSVLLAILLLSDPSSFFFDLVSREIRAGSAHVVTTAKFFPVTSEFSRVFFTPHSRSKVESRCTDPGLSRLQGWIKRRELRSRWCSRSTRSVGIYSRVDGKIFNDTVARSFSSWKDNSKFIHGTRFEILPPLRVE